MTDETAEKILRGWAKAYRETPEHRFPSDPHAEFFPVDLERAADEIKALREANKTFADHAIHGIAPSVGMPIDPPHAVISVAMQEIPEDGCEYEHIEAAYRAMRVALSSTEGK